MPDGVLGSPRSARSRLDPAPPTAPFWLDAPGAVGAGVLHALAFTLPGSAWMQTLAVAWFASCVAMHRSPARAALLGGVFSTVWLVGGVWWLFISMHRYGGLPAWMAALAVLALCAFLSIYLAFAMATWARLRRHGLPLLIDALAFAALWLLAELARGLIFTGFPWVAAGYAHADGALAPLAPWVGVYGIGAVSALVAALWAWTLRAVRVEQRASAGAMATALAALLLWWAPALAQRFAPAAFDATSGTGTISVALVQTNIPQDEKFATERQPEAIAWMLRTMVEARADLVVAPETAIPLLPEQLPPDFWREFSAHFQDGTRTALVGAPLGEFAKNEYTNSAIGISAEARALPGGFYRYDKHHLVPFGEFIPYGFRWFVDMMNMPLGDFTRGPLIAPSFEVKGQRIGPNICYEDLFGEELAARFVDAASAPTMLANLSNIAWFGESVAIDQHLQISRMRALELQRPMIRATNTGATVVIDHRGGVKHRIEPHTRGVLEGQVEGRAGVTPYAAWAGRWGLWPMVAAAVALLAAISLVPRPRS